MKMLWIFLMAAAFAIPCGAQGGVEGKWSCTSEDLKHTKLDWTLTITRPEVHLGALRKEGRDNDRFELEHVTFQEKTFSARIMLNPPDDTVSFTLTLDGDKLEGRFDGKNSGTGPYFCKR